MLKTELIEQNAALTTQNQRLARIVQTQLTWIVSIHEHYTATQKGLYSLCTGIDDARADFKDFLRKMNVQISDVVPPTEAVELISTPEKN